MQPAVFLDRDNTIILNDGHLGDPGAVRLMDGVADSIGRLDAAGLPVIVITNQSGVARGLFDEDDVRAVHRRIEGCLEEEIARPGIIRAWYFCPWHPDASVRAYRGDHPWRKPRPGMLHAAAREHHLDLTRSWMIGDQERDVLAGRAAGCRTVRLGVPETKTTADVLTPDLPGAADLVLAEWQA